MQQQVLKTRAMQILEGRLGEPLEVFIRRRYVDEGATLRDVADELGLSVGTVSRWLPQLGVPARFPGQRSPRAEAA